LPGLIVNTNSSGFELSALIAESNGQGVPLGFILSGNSKAAKDSHWEKPKHGAKTRVLANFLRYFQPKLPNLEFTITDKEMAEIDTFKEVFPQAKHQVCHWHSIKTVEGRLAEDRPTAVYNPVIANQRFSFIDLHWSPNTFKGFEDGNLELESGGVRPRVMNEEVLDYELERMVGDQYYYYYTS